MIRIGSICSGYGGLEMGIAAAVPGTEVVWVADYDPPTERNPAPAQGAARILAHRFPTVPNLGDITQTRWETTPVTDIICGGTPCQDISHAGARRGMRTGTRSGIWSSMVEAIDHHRPTLVVWENVRGALSAEADSGMEPCPICMGDERDSYLRALGRVLGDLAELGYDAAWCGLRASDVGAPHPRFRVFAVAWPTTDPGRVRIEPGRVTASGQTRRSHDQPAGCSRTPAIADADGTGLKGPIVAEPAGCPEPADRSVADPDSIGCEWCRDTDGRPRPENDRRSTFPDTESNRWDQGRTEPERQFRGFDVAECGCGAVAITNGGDEQQIQADDDKLSADRRSETLGGGALGTAGPGRTSVAGNGRTAGQSPTRRGSTSFNADAGQVFWGPYESAIRRWERVLNRSAPAPNQATGRDGKLQLSPEFAEWLMGVPAGWVTDPLIWAGMTQPAARNAQLRALGNGVVPHQAEAAVTYLIQFAPDWVRRSLSLTTDRTEDTA
jgi:DNA (cytosine-5)-methyltransferase 1